MSRATKLIAQVDECLFEELLVNNKVRDKESGKMGVIASISDTGEIKVQWEDGTEGTANAEALEKVEEPAAPVEEPPAAAGAEPVAAPSAIEPGAPGAGSTPMMTSYEAYCPKCHSKVTLKKRDKVEAWEGGLPKGWTEDSLKSFWNSLTGDHKHKVTACMNKMKGKVDDPGAFCGGLASRLGKR